MIDCYKFKELISDFIDEDISFHNRKLFEEHRNSCPTCKKLLESIQQTTKAMHNFSKLSVSEDFKQKLRDRILADRYARIQASRQKGFSFNKIPSFVYGFAAALVVVIVGFVLLNTQQGIQTPVPEYVKEQIQTAPQGPAVQDHSTESMAGSRSYQTVGGKVVSTEEIDSSRLDLHSEPDQTKKVEHPYNERIKVVNDKK